LFETFAADSSPDAVVEALQALDGIIYESGGRRLFVRHDMYVRPILASLEDFGELRDTITGVLKAYLKYGMPIMRHVSRQDGALFRFLFNHDFVYEQANNYGDSSRGREVYSEFEVPFQLDGHFWLQYGLFVAEIGAMEEAIDKLQKSIQAFPGNQFAHHALASLQLRLAYYNDSYDKIAQDAVGQAVQTLREMDANPAHKSDHYPIVTLASRHTGVLIKHGRKKEARAVAGDYLAKLQRLEKTNPTMQVTNAKEALVRYLALDIWTPPEWGEKIL
jgi:tetratricopeptide (TPR) repeat protein